MLPESSKALPAFASLGRLPGWGGFSRGLCPRLRVKKPPSGREVARRAGGREPRLCPKPSCLREALSPTACGRSPLPEGAKEFFDNLGAHSICARTVGTSGRPRGRIWNPPLRKKEAAAANAPLIRRCGATFPQGGRLERKERMNCNRIWNKRLVKVTLHR